MRGRSSPFAFVAVAAAAVFGAWYGAVRDWAVKEAAYRKLVGGAATDGATRE